MATKTLNSTTRKVSLGKEFHKHSLTIAWDKLPLGSRIVLRYDNDCYIGVERVSIGGTDTIVPFYSHKVTRQNSGETLFKNYTTEEEKSVFIEEKAKE